MSADTLLVILLVWSVAGLLAAFAFGMVIHKDSPDDEEGLASSAGPVKYIQGEQDKS